MSFQVNNGHILPASAESLDSIGTKFIPEALKWAQRKVLKTCAARAAFALDAHIFGYDAGWHEKAWGSTYFMRAVRELEARYKESEATGLRDPEIDFGITLSLYLPTGRSRRNILAYVGTEHPENCALFRETTGAVDYSYWDNTDRPEDITSGEWTRRGKLWAAATDERGWLCVKRRLFDRIAELTMRMPMDELRRDPASFIPSLNDRVSKIADRRCSEIWLERNPLQGDQPTLSQMMQNYYAGREYFRTTPDGQQELAELKAHIKARLSPALTFVDLEEDIPAKEKEALPVSPN